MNQAARGAFLLAVISVCHSVMGQSGSTELLRLETTISLPDIHGRIEHMSIDLKGQRLFVAALGNNLLEVIDLKENKRVQTVRGLAEPQGTAYLPASNRVFVANRKDGSVRAFDASACKMLQSLSYGDVQITSASIPAVAMSGLAMGTELWVNSIKGERSSRTSSWVHIPNRSSLRGTERESSSTYPDLGRSRLWIVKHSPFWIRGAPEASY